MFSVPLAAATLLPFMVVKWIFIGKGMGYTYRKMLKTEEPVEAISFKRWRDRV